MELWRKCNKCIDILLISPSAHISTDELRCRVWCCDRHLLACVEQKLYAEAGEVALQLASHQEQLCGPGHPMTIKILLDAAKHLRSCDKKQDRIVALQYAADGAAHALSTVKIQERAEALVLLREALMENDRMEAAAARQAELVDALKGHTGRMP